MKVIFMGTPEFSVACLSALIEKHEVLAVVTQPDKPKGRGNKVLYTPVKEEAVKHNITVLQPERIKKKEFVAELAQYDADIFVVAAYGQILSEKILNMPKYGCICVHASLLPEYRGASPIQQAVINGDTVSGVTIMQMDKGIDTGDMLYKREVEIDDSDTGGSLEKKVSKAGAGALLEALELIEKGEIAPEKQDNSLTSYAPLLQKEMGHIDWSQSPQEIVNLIRGMDPWPGAYTFYEDANIKVWKACVCLNELEEMQNGRSGEVMKTSVKEGIFVAAQGGIVQITEIQAPNGKRMRAADYLRGHEIKTAVIFK